MRSISPVQLQLLDFLYTVQSKKGTLPLPPTPTCADPVRNITKIRNTKKRTIPYAIKILITIFCYREGVVGKMFIAPNSWRPMVIEIQRIWKIHKLMYSTLRSALKAFKELTCLIFHFQQQSGADWAHLTLSEMDQRLFVSVSQKHFFCHNQRQSSVMTPSLYT